MHPDDHGPVVRLTRVTDRFVALLTGASLLLAVCGCSATSPSATPRSEASATPRAIVSQKETPGSVATATPLAKASSSASPSSTPNAKRAPAWHATGRMITSRAFHTATLLPDGRVLVAGGKVSVEVEKVSAHAELYDPTSGKWTATGSMTQARWDHSATLLPDGRVLVAGGQFSTDDQLASAELYDPASARWTATDSMHTARGGHTATLLPDGRVLVAGGYDLEGARIAKVEIMGLTAAELYDPSSGHWTPTGNMTEARAGGTATLLSDGRVLVAGGDMDGARSAELYDPGTGRWTPTGSMTGSRRDHAATLLPNGKVLVAGGFAGSGFTVDAPCSGPPEPCSTELYDPRSGRWTASGKMHADRIGHTATLLPDGTVLVVGLGTAAAPVPAELYQPSSGRWKATSGPAKTRGLTATLLLDGRVLATGDFSNDSRVAELYDPGHGS
jgi:hypothetical protein